MSYFKKIIASLSGVGSNQGKVIFTGSGLVGATQTFVVADGANALAPNLLTTSVWDVIKFDPAFMGISAPVQFVFTFDGVIQVDFNFVIKTSVGNRTLWLATSNFARTKRKVFSSTSSLLAVINTSSQMASVKLFNTNCYPVEAGDILSITNDSVTAGNFVLTDNVAGNIQSVNWIQVRCLEVNSNTITP